jgi:hypothetical protein
MAVGAGQGWPQPGQGKGARAAAAGDWPSAAATAAPPRPAVVEMLPLVPKRKRGRVGGSMERVGTMDALTVGAWVWPRAQYAGAKHAASIRFPPYAGRGAGGGCARPSPPLHLSSLYPSHPSPCRMRLPQQRRARAPRAWQPSHHQRPSISTHHLLLLFRRLPPPVLLSGGPRGAALQQAHPVRLPCG